MTADYLYRCIPCGKESTIMADLLNHACPHLYSICEHCHRQVTPGHSCPHDPNRLRDDLAQNSAARAGHEVGAAAADTVAGILYEADAAIDPVALAREVLRGREPTVVYVAFGETTTTSGQRDEDAGDER